MALTQKSLALSIRCRAAVLAAEAQERSSIRFVLGDKMNLTVRLGKQFPESSPCLPRQSGTGQQGTVRFTLSLSTKYMIDQISNYKITNITN